MSPSLERTGQSTDILAGGDKLKKRRTEIVIEIRNMRVWRKMGVPVSTWCPACAREVRMITPNEAAMIFGLSTRAIYSRIGTGEIHFRETPEGHLYICLDSIPIC